MPAAAQPPLGILRLFRALDHPLLQDLLGTLEALQHVSPHHVDAIGEGKRQQQHLQGRADLHGIGGQPAEVAQRHHRHADQQERPGRQEEARSGLFAEQAHHTGRHRDERGPSLPGWALPQKRRGPQA